MWDLGEVQVRGDFHLRPTESDTPGPACVQAGGGVGRTLESESHYIGLSTSRGQATVSAL